MYIKLFTQIDARKKKTTEHYYLNKDITLLCNMNVPVLFMAQQ